MPASKNRSAPIRAENENDEEWTLRKAFLDAQLGGFSFSLERLVNLSYMFLNVVMYGCTYSANVMQKLRELTKDLDVTNEISAKKRKHEDAFMETSQGDETGLAPVSNDQTATKPLKRSRLMNNLANGDEDNRDNHSIQSLLNQLRMEFQAVLKTSIRFSNQTPCNLVGNLARRLKLSLEFTYDNVVQDGPGPSSSKHCWKATAHVGQTLAYSAIHHHKKKAQQAACRRLFQDIISSHNDAVQSHNDTVQSAHSRQCPSCPPTVNEIGTTQRDTSDGSGTTQRDTSDGIGTTQRDTSDGIGTTQRDMSDGIGTTQRDTTDGIGTTQRDTTDGSGTTQRDTTDGSGTTQRDTSDGSGTTQRDTTDGIGTTQRDTTDGIGTTQRDASDGIGTTQRDTSDGSGTTQRDASDGSGTTQHDTSDGIGTTQRDMSDGIRTTQRDIGNGIVTSQHDIGSRIFGNVGVEPVVRNMDKDIDNAIALLSSGSDQFKPVFELKPALTGMLECLCFSNGVPLARVVDSTSEQAKQNAKSRALQRFQYEERLKVEKTELASASLKWDQLTAALDLMETNNFVMTQTGPLSPFGKYVFLFLQVSFGEAGIPFSYTLSKDALKVTFIVGNYVVGEGFGGSKKDICEAFGELLCPELLSRFWTIVHHQDIDCTAAEDPRAIVVNPKKVLTSYINDANLDWLVFGEGLSPEERLVIRGQATLLGLQAQSHGLEPFRRIIVSKKMTPFTILKHVAEVGPEAGSYALIPPTNAPAELLCDLI